jgi:hypothetical protein
MSDSWPPFAKGAGMTSLRASPKRRRLLMEGGASVPWTSTVTSWNRWVSEQDALPVPLSVDTRIMKLQMLGQAADLTHYIDSRERTDAGEETVHEVETSHPVAAKPAHQSLIVD